jgi:hypothetical protein
MKAHVTTLVAVLMGLTSSMAAKAIELPANDYPTYARADYVYACMQVNGQTPAVLDKCSCSIDAIAAILPFKEYEAAETVMSVRQRGGENASMFRTHTPYLEMVNNLKRAQVEGELRCF